MEKTKQESSMKGQVKSPSNREQTITNAGGMPPKWGVEKTFSENTPPNRYASDSTTGLGKP